MSKKIGFRHYDNEEQADKDKQQENETLAIVDFLKTHYAPIGGCDRKVYKTTAELVYELSNIVEVNSTVLAYQLTKARYHVEYLAGQPYWVMYEL